MAMAGAFEHHWNMAYRGKAKGGPDDPAGQRGWLVARAGQLYADVLRHDASHTVAE